MYICNATTKDKMSILDIRRRIRQGVFCVNKGGKCNYFLLPKYSDVHGATLCCPLKKHYTVVCENHANELDHKSLQQKFKENVKNKEVDQYFSVLVF